MPFRSIDITGLDSLMGGGIAPGRTVLLFGPPGLGKTTFCYKFACKGVNSKERVIYISTSSSFEIAATEFECDEKGLMSSFYYLDCYSWRQPGEKPAPKKDVWVADSVTNLNELNRAINNAIKELGGADRIVLDSVSDLLLYSEPAQVYKFLQLLHGIVTATGAAAIITLEEGLHDEKVNTTVNYICDGVIEMRPDGKRELRIARMTGQAHQRDWIRYDIKQDRTIEFNTTAEAKKGTQI